MSPKRSRPAPGAEIQAALDALPASGGTIYMSWEARVGRKAVEKAQKEGQRRALELVRELGHPEADPSLIRELGAGIAGEILSKTLGETRKKTLRRRSGS